MENKVFCPLVDKKITPIDCMENRDIKDEFIPEEYKKKKNWKNICRECEWHNF